jgi:hypothetical protein
MITSYNMGQLTHIVGFTQNIEHNYKVGDVLRFKCEGIITLKDAIKQSFSTKDNYKLLSKNYLQMPEVMVEC